MKRNIAIGKMLGLCIVLCVTLQAQSRILSWSTRAAAPGIGICQIQSHGNVRDTIYLCGGRTSNAIAVRSVLAYVPATDTWISSLPNMPAPRSHGCGDVIDSMVYACGGVDSAGTPRRASYVFNANTKTWTTIDSMPAAVYLASGASSGGRLCVFGSQNCGDTLYEYNTTNSTWTTRVLATRPPGRRAAAAAGTANHFYVLGGLSSSNTPMRDCWRYTRQMGGSWTQMDSMPGTRCMHAAYAVVGDSVIYVVGGNSIGLSAACDSIVYKYTIATNTWTTDTPLPTARGFLSLNRIGDKIYAQCGMNGTNFLTVNEEGGWALGSINETNARTMDYFMVYPNTIHRNAEVTYRVPEASWVGLNLFNINGAKIIEIRNHLESAGYKEVRLDVSMLPAGVYFLRLEINRVTDVRKLLVVR